MVVLLPLDSVIAVGGEHNTVVMQIMTTVWFLLK
jgi:hypothetical protein